MRPLFLATLETRNFTFKCLGETEADARSAMERAWVRHAAQTGATMRWNELADDVNVAEMRTGHVYRDGERIWAGTK